jgi:hypothetical protein
MRNWKRKQLAARGVTRLAGNGLAFVVVASDARNDT